MTSAVATLPQTALGPLRQIEAGLLDVDWAGATITEAKGSHVIMVSQPALVDEVIATTATGVDRQAAGVAS
jgi:hypothetical protein